MKQEEIKTLAENYCIQKFGAKTGNQSVIDAFIWAYNLAAREYNNRLIELTTIVNKKP